MYLRRLSMTNIQSHSDTVLEFVNGVNTITAEDNNDGKSTAIRALQHLFYGVTAIVRGPITTATTMKLEAEFDDGTVTVHRKVSKNKSLITQEWWLKTPDLGKRHYPEAAIPDDVVAFLNMRAVKFDETTSINLNFALQNPKNGPFLLGSRYSGTTRARMLGSVTSQQIFDNTSKAIKKDRRDKTKEVKVIREMRLKAATKLDEIKARVDPRNAYKRCQALHKEILELHKEVTELEELRDLLELSEKQLTRTRKSLSRTVRCEALTSLVKQLEDDGHDIRMLSTMFERASETGKALAIHQRRLSKLSEVPGMADLVRRVEANEIGPLCDLRSGITDALQRLRKTRQQIGCTDTGRLVDLYERCETESVRQASWSSVLSWHQQLQSTIGRTRNRRRAVAEKLQVQQNLLTNAVDATVMCPYSPFEIVLQKKCKEVMKV